MDRRSFIKTAVVGTVAGSLSARLAAAERYFPAKVDQGLFEGINRVRNPAAKSPLEKGHAPIITAPQTVKAGEPFSVEVAVGENLHPMGPTHWIEFIELRIGNTGAPIPAESRTRIFDKYAQGPTGERTNVNVGLGLYFCRLATEAHGGKIWVEEAELPTVFVVSLPESEPLDLS